MTAEGNGKPRSLRGVFRLRTFVGNRKEVKFPTLSLKTREGWGTRDLVMLKKDVDQGGDY